MSAAGVRETTLDQEWAGRRFETAWVQPGVSEGAIASDSAQARKELGDETPFARPRIGRPPARRCGQEAGREVSLQGKVRKKETYVS